MVVILDEYFGFHDRVDYLIMPSYSSGSSEEEVPYWAYADATYGIPVKCFCGRVVKLKANESGRKYYACPDSINEGTFDHIHQWWDDAVIEQCEILATRIENQKDLILSVDRGRINTEELEGRDPQAIGELREELARLQGEVRSLKEELGTSGDRFSMLIYITVIAAIAYIFRV
ncbi:uncharacterized protein LOC112089905 [Eutrema salsugineum]|uniref:uncharacterized protein LOC112089905 n=1 Tax=Eutrema salsugineum TaxID=72664 RepID=UPI000CED2859|nr:uncharacterized protein LOC112089905 [Eutrema salsugineum]